MERSLPPGANCCVRRTKPGALAIDEMRSFHRDPKPRSDRPEGTLRSVLSHWPDRVAGDEDVFAEALDRYVAQADGVAHALGAAAGHGRGCSGGADDLWRDDERDLVDEALVEERAVITPPPSTSSVEDRRDVPALRAAPQVTWPSASAGSDEDLGARRLDAAAPAQVRALRRRDECLRVAAEDAAVGVIRPRLSTTMRSG